jgi:hypothetical protein
MFLSKTGEPVQIELWTWVAIYNDDSALVQFDFDTEQYHYFDEIQTDKVIKFGLVNRANGKSHLLDIPTNSKLIHYYDNLLQSPLGGTVEHHRLYCFGYQNKTTKKIFTILPNDFIVETDKIGIL